VTVVNGATQPTSTPARYWYEQVNGITADARRILKAVDEAKRIYKGNSLATVIAALEAGQAVPGTTMSKEQAATWAAMVEAIAGFLQQEIAPGMTIEDGLYAVWPVVAETASEPSPVS
jgi:hypothetical protein